MGLKCSVIGHKYGEASVEREREEQGSEVVITIQERETCERCGKTRVVSENKEVTSIETPSDIAGEMVEEDASESTDETAAEDADEDTDDAVESADDVAPAADTDDGVETAVEPVDPDADDAEILDAESETPVGDSELDDPSTVEPVTDTEDVVEDDPEEDDGVIIDDDEEEPADSDREPGEWPEEPNSGGDDWSPETIAEDEDDDTEEESPEVEPLGGSAVTVPEGQFACPECDFSTDVESSSLRAGDFCPECHKGALVTTSE